MILRRCGALALLISLFLPSAAGAVVFTESRGVTITATVYPPGGPPPANNGGGGGGGGFDSVTPQTGITFSGRAFPGRAVTLLKNGTVAAETIAGPDAKFQLGLTGLAAGIHTFALYSEDKNGIRSLPSTFPIVVTSGATTGVSGIFLAPTVDVDKTEVRKGDVITIFGQAAPSSTVTIAVNSAEEQLLRTVSDQSGTYLYNLDTADLELGNHTTRSRASIGNDISTYGTPTSFTVGTKNTSKVQKRTNKADLNNDGKVSLVDFSMLAYWYKRSSPPLRMDLSGDGKVTLVDFSIMAFYWSG